MEKKQLYLIAGIAGLVLVILVSLLTYYLMKFKRTEADFFAERDSRIKYQTESNQLQNELTITQGELKAKVNKIDILESANTEIQQRVSRLSQAKAEAEAERERLEAEKRKREEEYKDLFDSLQKEIKNKEIEITNLEGRLTVNMLDRVLFDSGQAIIKPEGKAVLDKIAENFLSRFPDRDIRVEGHTDDRPFGGSVLRNWNLSTERAISAVRYLQEHARIDPTRLAAVGYAFYQPIDTNDTPEGRARNRRIEIIVLPPRK